MSLNPQIKHIEMMKKIQPTYRFRFDESVEQWQNRARDRLKALLGLPFEKCEENFRIEWTREEENETEIRFVFCSEDSVDVCCHLLLPANAPEKIPLIICLQGHSSGMHISLGRPKFPGDEEDLRTGDNNFARQVVKRGQAALTLEQRGFGERGGTPEGPSCYQPAVQALLLGRTLLGERCWDVSRAIDAVTAHFPQIDADRIAIMGNSGGGTASIYAAALDPRIAAVMPSCAFCSYMDSIGILTHCLCNYVPGIMKDFDMGDLAGCIAPRPLVMVNGREDDIFPLHAAEEQAKIAAETYRFSGAALSFRHVIGEGGHRFYAADAWPVFDELTGWRNTNQ